jgi:hypothetical protein
MARIKEGEVRVERLLNARIALNSLLRDLGQRKKTGKSYNL